MENIPERLSTSKAKGIAIKWVRRQTGLPPGYFVAAYNYLPKKHGRVVRVMVGTFLVMKIIVYDDESLEVLKDRRNHRHVLSLLPKIQLK